MATRILVLVTKNKTMGARIEHCYDNSSYFSVIYSMQAIDS